jgi:hypothetical protein
MNYSEEDTKSIVDQYKSAPNRETVDRLAQVYNKSARSIIGKLAKEGVYQRVEYRTKTGEIPVTKLQLVEELCSQLAVNESDLIGLEKAPKQTLKNLLDAIEELRLGEN